MKKKTTPSRKVDRELSLSEGFAVLSGKKAKRGGGTALIPRGHTPAPTPPGFEPMAPKGGTGEVKPRAMDVQIDPGALLVLAIERGMSREQLQDIMAMRRELAAERAQRLFFEDLALFQARCPVIEKLKAARDTTKKTADEPDGELLYMYAPYEDIAVQVQPIMTDCGFSATVRASVIEGKAKATCLLHHREGHTEETTFEVPVGEGTRRMSAMQKVAAATSFAKRYAFILALNIAMKGEDVDRPEDEPPAVSVPQARAGVATDEQGRVSPASAPRQAAPASPAAPQASAGPKSTGTPAERLKAAQVGLQGIMNRMHQVYGKDGRPLTNAEGKGVLKLPPNDDPRGPCYRLYTEAELEQYAAQGSTAKADAAKLENMADDWAAGLAERMAEDKGRRTT